MYVVEVLRRECVRSDIRNNIESFRETLNILTGEVL